MGILILACLLAQAPYQPVVPPPCGPAALYVICRLEGLAVDLDRVEGGFPKATPAGHSMAEIQSAGRAVGLELQGVEIPKGTLPLDRPAIVFLDKGGHGHFVVVRPVGHSGTLVQVIDGAASVEVVDRSKLVARPEWTGLALVPPRTSGIRRVLLALAAIIPSVLLASWLFLNYVRRIRPPAPGQIRLPSPAFML